MPTAFTLTLPSSFENAHIRFTGAALNAAPVIFRRSGERPRSLSSFHPPDDGGYLTACHGAGWFKGAGPIGEVPLHNAGGAQRLNVYVAGVRKGLHAGEIG